MHLHMPDYTPARHSSETVRSPAHIVGQERLIAYLGNRKDGSSGRMLRVEKSGSECCKSCRVVCRSQGSGPAGAGSDRSED